MVGFYVTEQGTCVQSLWLRNIGIRFFSYYSMSISVFRERCTDMINNRGYKLQDVSLYLNQYSQVQVAAIWILVDEVYKVQMPEKITSELECLVYEKIMVPYQVPSVQIVFTENGLCKFDQAFGFANCKQSIPASTSNFHRIASISKVITRLCVR